MSIRARLTAAIRTIVRKEALDSALDEELRGYVDELTERKMRQGLDAAAARRAALVETGGIEQVKESVRDVRAGRFVDALAQDVGYALRGLRRSPAFTAAAVLTLALGVGANTAIFSVVDGVLLRPAPVKDFDRIAMIWETDRQTGTTREPASVPDFLDFKARARTVKPVVALAAGEVNLTPPRGDPERLAAVRVSREMLPMLGVEPVAGRLFTEEEGRRGGPNSVLISESLWKRVFARDRSAIGAVLRLDDVPFTVAGVVPDAVDFGVLQILGAAAYSRGFTDRGEPVRVDVWLPHQPDPISSPRDTHGILLLGKLGPGIDVSVAQQEMEHIGRDLERAYSSNRGRGVHVELLSDVVFGPVRPTLLLLLGAVLLVLLVACANVANLLLARGAARAHEVGIRSALGAAGGRLLRQFLVESLVLSLIAGAGGILFAWIALRGLVALAPADIPRLSSVTIDGRVLGMTLFLAFGVGLVFGLVPALQARRVRLLDALTGSASARTSAGKRARRQRGALVVAEVSLAVMLTAGAGLLVRSLWQIQRVDTGFHSGGVLKAEYQLPRSRYPVNFANFPNFKEFHAFTEAVLRRAATLPGAQSAAVAGNHPLDPGFTNSFVIVGRENESGSYPEISVRRVTPGYFKTVGLALVRGRLFDDNDGTSAQPVVVINQTAERRFFNRAKAIGAKIRFWGASRAVVGIVADERSHGLDEAAPIALYTPLAQAPSVNGAGVLLVRTAADPSTLVRSIRQVIRDQDPQLAVFGIEPLDRTVSRSLAARRFSALLLGLFAAVAVMLAAVGIQGVLAYSVAQRTREFGVRMALGAEPGVIRASVVREALALVSLGLVLGIGGALLLTRFLRTLLFGVSPSDPVTFAGVLSFLLVVALAASSIPAWRATRVDPVAALRAE